MVYLEHCVIKLFRKHLVRGRLETVHQDEGFHVREFFWEWDCPRIKDFQLGHQFLHLVGKQEFVDAFVAGP